MTFSMDRDLLAVEPGVFIDVPFVGQQLMEATDGAVSGTTLTSSASDFAAAKVDAGSVVLIAGVPHEVIEQVDSNTLTVSLLRADDSQAATAGTQGSELDIKVRSFSPQANVVYSQLLQMLGIEVDDLDSQVTADSILSLSVMKQLEVLGVLECVYLGAMGISGDNKELAGKAEMYRKRFSQALRQATVLLDLDGDGKADAQRQLGVGQMVRV